MGATSGAVGQHAKWPEPHGEISQGTAGWSPGEPLPGNLNMVYSTECLGSAQRFLMLARV